MNSRLFEDNFCHRFPKPQYLGAKFKHLSWIAEQLPNGVHRVLDAFAGSQSVAFFFKQLGYEVYTNDFMNFNHQIGLALVQNSSVKLNDEDVETLLSSNVNPCMYNLMENIFQDLFFTKEECRFLDAFRSNVDRLKPEKRALALTVMNRALTRKVTMGHFAHTKALEYASNADRIRRNRSLIRHPKELFIELLAEYNASVFDNGHKNKSFNLDAIEIVKKLSDNVDLVYFDPPYCNSHADYQSFYHLLETYTNYWKDKQFVNAVHSYFPKYHSGFDTKTEIMSSLKSLFDNAYDIPYWIISYNDRSYPSMDEMLELIIPYKNVMACAKEYKNSVGGKGSVQGSKELLFVCMPK